MLREIRLYVTVQYSNRNEIGLILETIVQLSDLVAFLTLVISATRSEVVNIRL